MDVRGWLFAAAVEALGITFWPFGLLGTVNRWWRMRHGSYSSSIPLDSMNSDGELELAGDFQTAANLIDSQEVSQWQWRGTALTLTGWPPDNRICHKLDDW